jgi:hypothetical protein
MSFVTAEQIDTAADPQALLDLLIEADTLGLLTEADELPDRLRERILAFGSEAVPPLVALLENPGLSVATLLVDSEVQIIAVRLLGELRAIEALGAMLRIFWGTSPNADKIHEEILAALPHLGPAIMEPILAAYAATTDFYLRPELADVLSQLGVHDDRIFEILAREFGSDPCLGSGNFTNYRDPRALPLLHAALDRYDPQAKDQHPDYVLIEMVHAIRGAGGELTVEEVEKLDRIFGPRPLWHRQTPSGPSEVPE